MDILSHTFSGLAIGATALHFSKKKVSYKMFLLFSCGFAAFFPDLDVITQWSGFDTTFGNWFDLKEKGSLIYHQKRWFSHHALFHSLPMAILFTGILSLYFRLRRRVSWRSVWRENKLFFAAVFSAYLVHLFEDMPTPTFVWGGVAFLFPSEQYWGGKGYIWWWNNYDLFLIIISIFVLNISLTGLTLFRIRNVVTQSIASIILIIGVGLFNYQMLHRGYSFNYSGMSEHHQVWQMNEAKSLELQKEILGDELYEIMIKIDHSIPFWF
ncbi:MAG: hypothetical protein CMP61_02155 [Flavobacteriales bacterium]|nr:hypothetical protein [Flavobacteriales bacterium]|tara:strand:+ start:2924 stop:3727 length:804 start_codon:yes stop_codon:yes gene_type:complete